MHQLSEEALSTLDLFFRLKMAMTEEDFRLRRSTLSVLFDDLEEEGAAEEDL